MNWALLWKSLLLFTLVGYAILVVVVFFGGLKNIVQLFQDLNSGEENPE